MRDDELLFKLGFALMPAFLLIPMPEGAVLLAFCFAAGLLVWQGVLSPAGKIKKPFLKETASITGLFLIVAGTDLACKIFLPALRGSAGFFFPVVLLNGLLIFKNERPEVKSKLCPVFVFSLLGGHLLIAWGEQWTGSVNPGAVFLGAGFFLACLKYCLQKRWLKI